MSNCRYKHIPLETLHVEVERTLFASGMGCNEIHALIHLTPDAPSDENPIALLLEAKTILEQFLGARTLYGRFFLRQAYDLSECDDQLSAIIQPPLDGTPAALWLWLTQGCTNSAYRHTFLRGQSAPTTTPLLQGYKQSLESRGLTLADNCLRTWFFVKDIDHNYQELVESRKAFFLNEELTPQTHYIASTGINGTPLCPTDIVQMEAYTVEGLQPEQVQYLKGSSHLNPTSEYGVTFERGTAIEYRDRKHLLISGTASIDNHGQILYPDDAEKQAQRMLENIQVLLNEGGASLRDLVHGIIYLRREEDYPLVRHVVERVLPDLPKVCLLAPVCRPGWLVEMECMAAIPNNDEKWEAF